nr:anthranilate synthase component I family protein [Leifsonia psychrotolerans]
MEGWWDPATVFTCLYRNDSHAFWLDAGAGATQGISYLGAASGSSRFVTESVADGTVRITVPAARNHEARVVPQTIFDFLREDLGDHRGEKEREVSFELGWVGWFGYELGAQTVGTPTHASRQPDAAFLDVDRMIAFDHATRSVELIVPAADGVDESAEESVEAWVADVIDRLGRAAEVALGAPQPPDVVATWRHDPAAYRELVLECQSAISAGDAYQLCLTNEISLPVRPDPVETYLRLRAGSPSHHGGLLRFGEFALLSASPEQFLSVTSTGRVTTKPIKGTRPRGTTLAADARLNAELLASDKERAENLMIVDLMRNDLGRIAELGTVTVTSLLAVESYPHVHQLVSTVEARLAWGLTAVDALAACFPAGSMTGAPKASAMRILDRLENGSRGIYAGAFGYLGRDGALDLAMVIRSIVLGPDGASIGTGGGITALSDPDDEIEETRIKAAALLAVLGAGTGGATGPLRV